MIRPRWSRHANALAVNLSLGAGARAGSRSCYNYTCSRQFCCSHRRDHRHEDEAVGLPSRGELAKARRNLLSLDEERQKPPSAATSPASSTTGKSTAGLARWKRKPTSRREGGSVGGNGAGRHPSSRIGDAKGKPGQAKEVHAGKSTVSHPVWPQLKRKSQNLDGTSVSEENKHTFNSAQGPRTTQTSRKPSPFTPRTPTGTLAKTGQANTKRHLHPKTALSRGKAQIPPPVANPASRLMLVIDGLSPNLNASDFYRLAPSDLASWQSVIKKVQQQRDPKTLEPLGRYLVSFSNVEAATAYCEKLLRLHRLSKLRLGSASGLWESQVPPHLRASLFDGNTGVNSNTTNLSAMPIASSVSALSSTPEATSSSSGSTTTLTDLVDAFTLAPGSQDLLTIERKRVTISRPWTQKLSQVVEPLGYGEKPAIVLLDVYPPTLTASELFNFVRLDGQNRSLRWQVCMPHHLKAAASQPSPSVREIKGSENSNTKNGPPSLELKDHQTLERLKSRFVIVCADWSEARRFQRSWNHRVLTTSRPRPGSFMVHASIINW